MVVGVVGSGSGMMMGLLTAPVPITTSSPLGSVTCPVPIAGISLLSILPPHWKNDCLNSMKPEKRL